MKRWADVLVPQNAWCLCPACHWETTRDGVEFAELVDRTIGRTLYERLRKVAYEGVGVKVDWSEERKRLRRELNDLKEAA